MQVELATAVPDSAHSVLSQAFLAGLQDGDELHISPELFASQLDIEKQQLAELAHVHRNTITRMPRSPVLQKYLRESIRVLAAATDLNGSSKKAAFWFRNQPLADPVTPVENPLATSVPRHAATVILLRE